MSLRRLVPALVSTVLVAAGCGPSKPPGPPPTPAVTVMRMQSQSLPLTRELVGRLSSLRTADVRARVPGILVKRLYTEGSEVKEGQPLFQIDPEPYEAALDAAEAALAQAQANALKARADAGRARKLGPSGLMSNQDVDTAVATELSTAAQVKQAEANLRTARINLGYARVTAPISGRSGQQRVTEGALVGQGDATLLTTIDQIDHLYVNFDRPADEILRLRLQQANGQVTLLAPDKALLQIILPDGSTYPIKGSVDFDDVIVDPTQASLAFRGIIPNPDRQLMPGLFVTVRLLLGRQNHVFLVPQAVVRRDGAGAYVQVVGADGKVARRDIRAESVSGTNWVVTSGLGDGDRVITTDIDSMRPGEKVTITATTPPPPAGGAPQAQATGA